MKKMHLLILLLFMVLPHPSHSQDPDWGLIANPEFEGDSVRSAVFFTGNWRNGVQFYDYNPVNNTGLFTIHPADARHLGWSESTANREFAVKSLVEAGVNIINFSYWGLPGTDNWAFWAPMQSSTASHDELFDAALNKEILLAPFIESYAATDDFDGFSFMDDFPGTQADPSPDLRVRIEDLIDRYLISPANAQWPSKWARLYDRNGDERYLISIIHVASNQGGITDQAFAEGFDHLAGKIYEDLGIRVGFALDILPPYSYAGGLFKATPTSTGAYLNQQDAVLAIQCFIPEIWQGTSNEIHLIRWKDGFARSWMNTGIPWIHDISSGYDAHVVFPASPVYGNNAHWQYIQDSLIQELKPRSLAFHAWNGYTEGMAGVPSLQYGDDIYEWVCELFGGNCWYEPEPEPESIYDLSQKNQVLRVFPNPAQDNIRVDLSETGEEISGIVLVNPDGRKILQVQPDVFSISGCPEIHVNSLQAGMYILRINTKENQYQQAVYINP